jgi:hypothetical protein
MIDFLKVRLRSNARFQLLPFDKIDEREQLSVKPLTAEPDFYGLLAPPANSELPAKSVSRDAALLFLTLREPACIPHLLRSLFGDEVQDRVRELVLDGVFEIEQAGKFVSGAAAFPELTGRNGQVPGSRVAQLSLEAITYAAALEGLAVTDLAARLYIYNRAPATPQFQRQFADDDRLLTYLTAGAATLGQLESHWSREISQQAWLMWQRPASGRGHNCKLYVSPTLDSLPQAFQIAVDTFVRVKCSHFKIGRTAFGLLRPDKLVAYFTSLEQLKEAAELIRASAAGIAAQGVPFTGAIDAEGLVSWGMDPPRFEQVLPGQEHQSWRQWVAGRIAVYTLAARESGAENIPEFVLHRVSLDGIDTTTWSPNLAIWRGRAGTEEDVA